MATTYADSFNRSGTLAPGSTESGGGTWNYSGNGAASANGASAVVNLAGGFLFLDLGFGDVDLSTVMQGQGSIVVRANPNDGRCVRLRLSSQSYASGGYVSRPQYTARWTHPPCENKDSYSTQCNNASFPEFEKINCFTGNYDSAGRPIYYEGYKYRASVTQGGTCQVYESSSYTVYTATLEDVAADGKVTSVASRQVNYSTTLRLVATSTTVQAFANGTLLGSLNDTDATRRAGGRHGILGTAVADEFSLTLLNTAPNAPILVGPPAGAVVDRTQPVSLSWQFSDQDATDVQSTAQIELTIGNSAPATYTVSTEQYVTFHPNVLQFPDGAVVSWRVRTSDAQGVVGPYSTSSTFTARTPPTAPTITAPEAGSTIPTEAFAVTWIAAAQDAYEVQHTSTDGATVYETVTGSAPAARSARLSFAVNGRAERVRVRVRSGGLWSAWASVNVTVSYTPPAQPRVLATALPDLAAVQVDVTCPIPSGSQPTALRFDVFRQDVSGGELGEVRLVADAVPSEGNPVTWIDYTPASGVRYSYRAKVYGANGTTSSS